MTFQYITIARINTISFFYIMTHKAGYMYALLLNESNNDHLINSLLSKLIQEISVYERLLLASITIQQVLKKW